MAKLVLYIATSLDGYIARTGGEIDWLEQVSNPNQIDHGYQGFLSGIGALVMGRKTYDKILGFGIDWPYPDLACFVASRRGTLEVGSPNTTHISDDLEETIVQLKADLSQDIWLVGGGELVQYLLQAQLIDQVIITLVPVTLGDGIRLFPPPGPIQDWELDKVERFETGLVSLSYTRKES